jgi:hypothetical protein
VTNIIQFFGAPGLQDVPVLLRLQGTFLAKQAWVDLCIHIRLTLSCSGQIAPESAGKLATLAERWHVSPQTLHKLNMDIVLLATNLGFGLLLHRFFMMKIPTLNIPGSRSLSYQCELHCNLKT